MYQGHTDFTSFLSVAAGSLAASFPTGSSAAASASIAAQGTQLLEADTDTVFDPGTSVTSIDYQFQCSSDGGTTWYAVAGRFAIDGLPTDSLEVPVSLGATVRRKLLCDAHTGSSLVRLVARRTGTASGTDAAVCSRLRMVH